jgi:hypothetical protein
MILINLQGSCLNPLDCIDARAAAATAAVSGESVCCMDSPPVARVVPADVAMLEATAALKFAAAAAAKAAACCCCWFGLPSGFVRPKSEYFKGFY